MLVILIQGVCELAQDVTIIVLKHAAIEHCAKHLHRNAGGQEGLLKAASVSNSLLSLKLRPDRIEDHPIFGERCSHRGLLVRVKKGKQGTSAEVVARVAASYKFNGLADFQMCPDVTLQVPSTQVKLHRQALGI